MSEIDDLKKEIETLKAHIEQVDDWANGIFQLLNVALIPLLRQNNDLADKTLSVLKGIDEEYQQAKRGLPTECPVGLYEAGSMFYRGFQRIEDFDDRVVRRQQKK